MALSIINETVQKTLEHRAWMIVKKIDRHWNNHPPFRCILAGGCFSKDINDIDLFPRDEIPAPSLELASSTANAQTYRGGDWPIQVCNYNKGSLPALVDAFDFAHIQCGADIILGSNDPHVSQVYFTDAFVAARASQTTWFIASEFPLSSLLRAGKYYKSGMVSRPAYIRCVINSLIQTMDRGFMDYDDFKRQLDAVDLGLLHDEISEVGRANLDALFARLRKDK